VVMDISRVRLHIFIVLTAMIISLSAVSLVFAEDQANAKVQALRQTGKQLLDVGYEQYRRGMYDSAKTTLDKAAGYKDYLSVSDASKLEELLGKLNSQPSQPSQPSSPVVDQNTTAEPAVVEQPIAAQQTQTVIVSEPIQIQVQQPADDNQYIEFIPVDSGDIRQAEQNQPPMIPVEVKDEFITPLPESDVEADVSEYALQQPEPLKPSIPAVEAEKAKEDYIEVVKQKQRIQQSYTKAIVNEAVARAREYADKEDFIKAKDEISRATAVVEKNKLLLGDEDYAQYTATLSQLLGEVNARQTEVENQKAEKAKAQAKASQENLRAQQTADRQKRIGDLMTHSAEYQEQQRYPQALAQVETLLAIDPTNREALRSKQMLEDIINLRRQVELRKEMGREEQDVLHEAQESMVPQAGPPMRFPRNWQDIAAKRKPTIITGLTAADAAVYKQLETLVDLSDLTPDTPIEEAIEIIRLSVDPPLKIVVRWKDLADNAYVERDTIIGTQGLNGIPVGKGLKELLDSVSGGIAKIAYSVDEGIITIATTESLPNKLDTHVYDITELIGAPANYRADLATQQDVTGTQTTTMDATQLQALRAQNAAVIMQMIQDTIAPMSWLINGGEGTISSHGNRLVISQTPQVHEQVQKLLMEDLRESLGYQVSIETRFLFVTENFLEDIGLDMRVDFPLGLGKFSSMRFNQGSYEYTVPTETLVPGSLATTSATSVTANPAIWLGSGVQYGSLLDNLSLTFFLRATQAHRDAKMLTAPRVTVLSGESAYIRVAKEVAYVSDYQFEDITGTGVDQPTRVIANPTTDTVTGGVVLNVTPTISADKKYVILEVSTNYTKTDFRDFPVYSATTGEPAKIQLPTLEVSEVQTRVSVPDGGTLLIGGQKLSAEVNKEAGVPGLSKMPIFGRLFSNRSKVKDQDILLILVKPSIILQEEYERDYFAPLE
jgi:type II secretory pathway component GspD/PulD (secretin)